MCNKVKHRDSSLSKCGETSPRRRRRPRHPTKGMCVESVTGPTFRQKHLGVMTVCLNWVEMRGVLGKMATSYVVPSVTGTRVLFASSRLTGEAIITFIGHGRHVN